MYMSAAERKAAQRDRDRMKGLVEVQVKVHADDAQKVRAFAAELCDEYSPKLDWQEGEPPTVGTLAEIGAKVGDVVECIEWIGVSFTPGEKYTVMNYACLQEGPDLECGGKWRLVSRANPGPVITETVTRKRIVSGVYGKVSIGFDGPNGDVLLVDLTQGLLAEDLTAAIETLTAIRDYMENNA